MPKLLIYMSIISISIFLILSIIKKTSNPGSVVGTLHHATRESNMRLNQQMIIICVKKKIEKNLTLL